MVEQIKEKTEYLIPIILIGNKIDLEEERCISKEQGENLAKNCCSGIKLYETSCKTGKKLKKQLMIYLNKFIINFPGIIWMEEIILKLMRKKEKKRRNVVNK